jgi:hypothetical protein
MKQKDLFDDPGKPITVVIDVSRPQLLPGVVDAGPEFDAAQMLVKTSIRLPHGSSV